MWLPAYRQCQALLPGGAVEETAVIAAGPEGDDQR